MGGSDPTPSADPARGITARTAIVHDWFQGYHGAERVVEAIRAGIFAEQSRPDIFTFQAARHLLPPDLAAAIVQESTLSRLPGLRQDAAGEGRWRYLLPYMPYYFSHLDLEGYELVISSSHACAFHVRPPATAVHVCYCHTPMRYAWLPETDERDLGWLPRAALEMLAPRLRRDDRRASAGPNSFVANSAAVADRIRRFYGREAIVIPPPVEVEEFDAGREKDRDHFVWIHRLVPYKRPAVVVEAFRELPYRLTMVGVGPLEAELRRSLPPNVELRGWTPRGDVAALLAGAGGFIHVGEEDFGITMVEALASGTPVIALGRGGALDIVRPGVDGILLEEATPAAVREAARALRSRRWEAEALRVRAGEFSRERFERRLREHVEALLAGRVTRP
jgi:glycosyltransferase involved in cell wall biosynthesis